jgi:predicted GIY-YIG superfamily endonuclease
VAIVEDFGYWFDRKEEAVVTEKKVKKLRLSKKMGIFGG